MGGSGHFQPFLFIPSSAHFRPSSTKCYPSNWHNSDAINACFLKRLTL
jgi:hypothetical protein